MKASHFSRDVQELIGLLAAHEVRYVLVGGEAVIYYGFARLTGDVDFFYSTEPENTDRLYAALLDFWDGDVRGYRTRPRFGLPISWSSSACLPIGSTY